MREELLLGLAVLPFLMGAAAAPSHEAHVAFTFQDPDITEASALVVHGDLAFTVNDSGDSGRVFTVDTRTGETVGVTSWSGEPTDDEALAPAGDGEVWVGDIGDNTESREAVRVRRVPVGPGNHVTDAPAYDLVYPDGPHNAETLLSDPTSGQLYLATKGVLGGTLYAVPTRLSADRPNELTPLGPVLPIATDGSFFPDGRHIVIRNYTTAEVYAFPSLEPLGSFSLPQQEQGEGLAVTADDRLLLSSEGVRQPVVRATMPADLREAVAPATSPTPAASASPEDHSTVSREDRELPEATATSPSAWPWALTGLLAVGFIVVLTRSLRQR